MTHVKWYKHEEGLTHPRVLLEDNEWKEGNKKDVWIGLKTNKNKNNESKEYILNSEYVHDVLLEKTIRPVNR